jgi:HEAT repeat protein
VLIEMLTNQDWVVGGDAARVFARIGPETLPEVIKALEEVLKTDASERPKVVLWALRGFGESAAPAVPAVTHALTHANANVRHAAAETFGAIGPQALTAVPALSQALNDEAPHVHQAAARALKRIQGGPESRAGAWRAVTSGPKRTCGGAPVVEEWPSRWRRSALVLLEVI